MPRRRSALVSALLALCLVTSPGCATLPGLLTGAFTGAVDAPAEVYRHHRGVFEHNPIYWPFNLVVFVPLGIATGPLVGMCKGIALDVQWLLDQMGYERVFQTYREPSIWRPFTIHW